MRVAVGRAGRSPRGWGLSRAIVRRAPWTAAAWVAVAACGDASSKLPTTPDPPPPGHHAGASCQRCHSAFRVAGTVFSNREGTGLAASAAVVLTRSDGSTLVLDEVDRFGNFASSVATAGRYLVRVGNRTSRSWHGIPEQGSCNECHSPRGHDPGGNARALPALHTVLPEDNSCAHCHHFPATMAGARLRAPGALNTEDAAPPVPGSRVRIGTQVYAFDPGAHTITTLRPDIFAPGYFSMFDVILAVARQQGIALEYSWDPARKTHFIESIDGRRANYWYRFSYDAGTGNQAELGLRREYRWDEALWRPGVWIQVTEGEALDEIRAAYLREIQREAEHGPIVPLVTISVNPSSVQGNPPGSGRVTVTREFRNVRVTPHNVRGAGTPAPYSRPFRPGVVTSLDILLSLHAQGALNLVTSVFYSHLGGKYIDSHYVTAMGFPGVGTAHASGRHGFTYTTGNGTPQRLVNDANRTFHITADIAVLHAPDFSTWVWRELGNPFYETVAPSPQLLAHSVAEDHAALDRSFNLHTPVVGADGREAHVSYNVFDAGKVARLTVRDMAGTVVAVLHEGRQVNMGVQTLRWRPTIPPGEPLHLVMEYGRDVQVRTLGR